MKLFYKGLDPAQTAFPLVSKWLVSLDAFEALISEARTPCLNITTDKSEFTMLKQMCLPIIIKNVSRI